MKVILPSPYHNSEDIIEIDPWDTWSADITIAVIVSPLLKQLKETTHGAPYVDMEDVPEELQCDASKKAFETDSTHFKRWDWVLDEMIFAMEEHVKDKIEMWSDEKYQERIDNGFRLFGKYFRSLWD